ncbi:hypothetical protein HGRIS_003800 [Hohenbuehelia grisea]|uniref:Uncharacterized protein n=1 Tax=Hohenbuehelia grisea TaxID=104357 RepID=A0ABR3JHG2_9AGAR
MDTLDLVASSKSLQSTSTADEQFRPRLSPWRLLPVVIIYHCATGIVEITELLSTFRSSRTQMNWSPDGCTILNKTLSVRLVTQALIVAWAVINMLTTGFWTRFGDIHGRRSVLIVCVSATLARYIIAILGNTELFSPHVLTSKRLASVVHGIAGGGTTFTAVTLAFSDDFVSPNWSVSWFALLLGLNTLFPAMRMFSLRLEGTLGYIHNGENIRTTIWFNLSVGLALSIVATALAVFLLPETSSRAQASQAREGHERLSRPRRLVKQVFAGFVSMVTVFNPETEWHGPNMRMFGLGSLILSFASNVSEEQLDYALGGFGNPHRTFVRPVAYIAIFGIPLAYLILIPALTLLFRWKPRITLANDFRAKARPIVWLNMGIIFGSILADSLGLLVAGFTGFAVRPSQVSLSSLYIVTSLFKAASEPAVFALGATYLDILGQKSQTGTLFGALAVIRELSTSTTV